MDTAVKELDCVVCKEDLVFNDREGDEWVGDETDEDEDDASEGQIILTGPLWV